jgi:hypothetical protein
VLVATFGPDGSGKCSRLDVCRFSAEELQATLGPDFTTIASATEVHTKP